jgi:hypothetical protein
LRAGPYICLITPGGSENVDFEAIERVDIILCPIVPLASEKEAR